VNKHIISYLSFGADSLVLGDTCICSGARSVKKRICEYRDIRYIFECFYSVAPHAIQRKTVDGAVCEAGVHSPLNVFIALPQVLSQEGQWKTKSAK
jgi:hypothetical protein